MRFFYLLGSAVFFLASIIVLVAMDLPSAWHRALVATAAIVCGAVLWWIFLGLFRAQVYLRSSDETWEQKAIKLRTLLHAVRARQVGVELAKSVTRPPSRTGKDSAA
jgi:membrane protein YqaA with SNARE-associated domain